MEDEALLEIMRRRRSVRQYDSKERVGPGELRKLIEAARWAPSANNRQLWKFISVTRPELISKIAAETGRIVTGLILRRNNQFKADYNLQNYRRDLLFFQNAPAVIFVLGRQTNGFLEATADEAGLMRQAALLSLGAAIQNLLLLAETMNLDACWMTGPLVARSCIEALLHVTAPWELVSVIPVGKGTGKEAGAGSQRKPIQKIWECFEDATTN